MVQRRVDEQPRPRGEQGARADRDQAVRRVRVEERVAQPVVQPPGGHRDLRRDPGDVGRRLADHDDPGRRAELFRQRNEIAQRQPDRRRQGRDRAREAKAKARRQPAAFAVQVGETEGFGRPGDVEQQRVRDDDEEDVDELGARDHVQRTSGSQHTSGPGPARHGRDPMSETDSKLSALRRDRSSGRRYVRMRCASTRPFFHACPEPVRWTPPGCGLAGLLAAALAWWPVFPPVPQADSGHGAPRLESTVDASITPGDDFFAYANGGWLKATAIPAGKERWTNRDELEALSRRRIAELLDAASAAPAGSDARKVADFRAAYLNEAAIEARGLESLRPLLERVEKVSDRAELTRLLGRSVRADVDPMGFGVYQSAGVLGLAVEQSIHGEKTNTAFLVQGGLGLPDREDYLSAEAGKDALRGRYREYIAKMLALAGFPRADERASAVLALEAALAQSQGTREASSNDRNADNLWTRSDFAQRAPGMDWTVFFDAAGPGRPGGARRLAAHRRDRAGGAGRVAAARGLEGLPALPRHPRLRGRAAARVCRAGAGAARRHGGGAAALPRRPRARCHASRP